MCALSLGWLSGCAPISVDEPVSTVTSTEAPTISSPVVTVTSPVITQPAIQLTYVSEQETDRYGVYEISFGCPDDSTPCLDKPKFLFEIDPSVSSISWAPNGQRVVYAANGAEDRGDIFVADADGQNRENITQTPSASEAFPAWSPDGSRIAYEACLESGCALVSSSPGGTDQVQLLSRADVASPRMIAWSSDGLKIAFLSPDRTTGLAQVYVANLDGSDLVRLTDKPTSHLSPAFSPDGTWVSFVRDTDPDTLENSNIFRLHPDGAGESNVTAGVVSKQLSQAWSPLGNWIAFDGQQDAQFDIFLIRPDGTGLVNLTNSSDVDEFTPTWRWSPVP
jgi:Tol biopolymer transport system component